MRIPSPTHRTLRKYGLSEKEWRDLLKAQKNKCPVCQRRFGKVYGKSGKPLLPVVDHIHVRRYKKLFPWEKVRWVRGLPCNYCNRRLVGRGMTLEIARNIVLYLENHEARINKTH